MAQLLRVVCMMRVYSRTTLSQVLTITSEATLRRKERDGEGLGRIDSCCLDVLGLPRIVYNAQVNLLDTTVIYVSSEIS